MEQCVISSIRKFFADIVFSTNYRHCVSALRLVRYWNSHYIFLAYSLLRYLVRIVNLRLFLNLMLSWCLCYVYYEWINRRKKWNKNIVVYCLTYHVWTVFAVINNWIAMKEIQLLKNTKNFCINFLKHKQNWDNT